MSRTERNEIDIVVDIPMVKRQNLALFQYNVGLQVSYLHRLELTQCNIRGHSRLPYHQMQWQDITLFSKLERYPRRCGFSNTSIA